MINMVSKVNGIGGQLEKRVNSYGVIRMYPELV